MHKTDDNNPQGKEEYADAWWYRVYLAVIIVTVIVITLLWSFSKAFR